LLPEFSFAGVFLAGLLSFLSPCILPLIPPYLCFIGGVSLAELKREGAARPDQRRIFLASLAFVLGFATVFILLGASASVLGDWLNRYFDRLAWVAGGIIIVLGLHFLGVLRFGFLYREWRVQSAARPSNWLGAYVVGLAFAFGWTPCVGPILASILLIAGTKASAWAGIWLLGTYAAGIGLPFLLAALFIQPFLAAFQRWKAYLGLIEKMMGAVLVLTGVLFIVGGIPKLSELILKLVPALGLIG